MHPGKNLSTTFFGKTIQTSSLILFHKIAKRYIAQIGGARKLVTVLKIIFIRFNLSKILDGLTEYSQIIFHLVQQI